MFRTRRRPTPLRKAHLRLEMLEDRCVPAGFLQTNLVSDVPGLATSLDPNLKNPWGLVAGPGGPFWVSDNNAGVSTLYNGAGQPFPVFNPLVVNIPTAGGAATGGTPSGIVFNGSKTDFVISQGGNSGPAVFLFATEDGLIAGWSPGVDFTHAIVAASKPGAVYEGLASVTTGLGTFLLATNANGGIDVYDSKFDLINTVDDASVPAGYTPYGIQNIGGTIYITYANQGLFPSPVGNGLVDTFDPATGTFHRLITGGNLDLPWGMVIAPSNFGEFSGDLLVGNVGDGHIDAYNPTSGAFVGQLKDSNGNVFTEQGLWSLKFGNGGLAGDSDTLFFTAGINGYSDGLFGSLQVPRRPVNPEPTPTSIIPHLPASPELFVSTNSPTGDQNPYGIAYVPQGFAKGGSLNPGDLLISNFNNSANLQGTGSTIMRVTPNGQTSVFFQGPSGIGLTTALGVLRNGFVLVGNVPTSDGTTNTITNGSLFILDKNGNIVANLTDPNLLQGPWDLTVNDLGDHAQVFVSNVLSGTITRIDLTVPKNGTPSVDSMTQIGSGYVFRTDPSALVVGPTGLAYDAQRDILYVASTGDNAIFAIAHARGRNSDAGIGRLVYKDDAHLHGPLGLVLAPNGDLITANGDAVNADPMHPSEIVEFTTTGHFVGQISIHPNADAAFGIALQFTEPGDEVDFAAVDDNTNSVHVWTVPVTTFEDMFERGAGASAAVAPSGHASLTRSSATDMAFLGSHLGATSPTFTPAPQPSPATAHTGAQPQASLPANTHSGTSAVALSGGAEGPSGSARDAIFAELGISPN